MYPVSFFIKPQQSWVDNSKQAYLLLQPVSFFTIGERWRGPFDGEFQDNCGKYLSIHDYFVMKLKNTLLQLMNYIILKLNLMKLAGNITKHAVLSVFVQSQSTFFSNKAYIERGILELLNGKHIYLLTMGMGPNLAPNKP